MSKSTRGNWLPILVTLAGVPFILWACLNLKSNTADILSWLPDESPARREYDEFIRAFGVDERVVVGWPGSTLDDPRLPAFIERLQADDADRSDPLVHSVVAGPDLLDELTNGDLALSRPEAIRRLQHLFIGPDQETTNVILQTTEAGRIDRLAVLNGVFTAAEAVGLDADELKIGGHAVTAMAVDETTRKSFNTLMLPAGLISLVVAWICLRDLRLTLLVLSVAGYVAGLSMATVYYTGGQMNVILTVMPVLMLVLGLSGGIHLIHYYEEAVAEHGRDQAARHALRAGWVPCALSTFTTALGLASLGVSKISIIRSFGLYSAAGLVLGLLVLMTVIPAVLSLWKPAVRGRRTTSAHERRKSNGSFTDWVSRSHAWLTATCLAGVIWGGLGFIRAETAVDMERMFSSDSELIRDHQWIESEIGPLKSFDVLVEFGADADEDFLQRMELIQQIEAYVQDQPQMGATLSISNFAPDVPRGGGLRQMIRRKVMAKALANRIGYFESQGLMASVNGRELWRIQVRTPTTATLDFAKLTADLRTTMETGLSPDGGSEVDIRLAGLTPLFHDTQEQLLADLIKSFVIAFILITPIMMWVLSSVPAGLMAMIPNVFPALCVFGAMGWLGITIDIGAVVTASVALGIAVDDTLHFLTWYARARKQDLEPLDAIRFAHRKCAKAMVQTTMVCGLGLMVFALSDFVPISRFATLMFVLLVTALVGDLLLLAGILAGPCGRWIGAQKS